MSVEKVWKHGDYEITYSEGRSKFVVSLNGESLAERDNLKAAKLYADGHEFRQNNPKLKFEPFEAYYRPYGNKPELVRITSVTEHGEAWIRRNINGKGKESRERIGSWRVGDLYVKNEASQETIAAWDDLDKAIKVLESKQEALMESLRKVKLPKVEVPA